jgi:hypothetical protein
MTRLRRFTRTDPAERGHELGDPRPRRVAGTSIALPNQLGADGPCSPPDPATTTVVGPGIDPIPHQGATPC